MRHIVIALFATCVGATCLAQGKVENTLGGMLEGYLRMLAESCPRQEADLADAKAKNDLGRTIVLGQLHQTMCVCHPEKARALLKSVPKEKLAAQAVGDNEFNKTAVPGIMEPCVGEQLDAMFAGEECTGFHSTDIRQGTPQAKFCGCMHEATKDWSDADATVLFREVGVYNMKFRAAKENKTDPPESTPFVDKYVASLQHCGGGEEFRK